MTFEFNKVSELSFLVKNNNDISNEINRTIKAKSFGRYVMWFSVLVQLRNQNRNLRPKKRHKQMSIMDIISDGFVRAVHQVEHRGLTNLLTVI